MIIPPFGVLVFITPSAQKALFLQNCIYKLCVCVCVRTRCGVHMHKQQSENKPQESLLSFHQGVIVSAIICKVILLPLENFAQGIPEVLFFSFQSQTGVLIQSFLVYLVCLLVVCFLSSLGYKNICCLVPSCILNSNNSRRQPTKIFLYYSCSIVHILNTC